MARLGKYICVTLLDFSEKKVHTLEDVHIIAEINFAENAINFLTRFLSLIDLLIHIF